MLCIDSVGYWFFEWFYEGVFFGEDDSLGYGWFFEIICECVRVLYVVYCKWMNVCFFVSVEEIGIFLKEKMGVGVVCLFMKLVDGFWLMFYVFKVLEEY